MGYLFPPYWSQGDAPARTTRGPHPLLPNAGCRGAVTAQQMHYATSEFDNGRGRLLNNGPQWPNYYIGIDQYTLCKLLSPSRAPVQYSLTGHCPLCCLPWGVPGPLFPILLTVSMAMFVLTVDQTLDQGVKFVSYLSHFFKFQR